MAAQIYLQPPPVFQSLVPQVTTSVFIAAGQYPLLWHNKSRGGSIFIYMYYIEYISVIKSENKMPLFGTNISQQRLINNLNKYLEWNNYPLVMNRTGLCNGLASVYAKYAVQGQQKQFFDLLETAATMNPESSSNTDIDQFIIEVIQSFDVERFSPNLTQSRSMEMLTIEGQHLKPSFTLAMITSDQNWGDIIKSLELEDGEAMHITGLTHTIAVTKNNGKYTVYDPNYSSGYKEFPNEKQLIRELHYNVLKSSNRLEDMARPYGLESLAGLYKPVTNAIGRSLGMTDSLGLAVHVIRNPKDHRPRAFPNVTELYAKYLDTPNKVNQSVRAKDTIRNNLIFAASFYDNKDVIDKLFALDPDNKDNQFLDLALACSIRHNNLSSLTALIQKIPKDKLSEYLSSSLYVALMCGRKEAFLQILDKVGIKNGCDACINVNGLVKASTGRNVDLLSMILDKSSEKLTDKIILDVIPRVLESKSSKNNQGTADCLKLLVSRLKKPLDEQQLLTYLTLAIKENKPEMLNFLTEEINKLPPETAKGMFSTIKMNISAVERTPTSILTCLQSSGVSFTKEAQAIIDYKSKHKPINSLLKIGIVLYKFTDFIKETLMKTEGVKYDIEKFHTLKAQLQTLFPCDDKEPKTDIGKRHPR